MTLPDKFVSRDLCYESSDLMCMFVNIFSPDTSDSYVQMYVGNPAAAGTTSQSLKLMKTGSSSQVLTVCLVRCEQFVRVFQQIFLNQCHVSNINCATVHDFLVLFGMQHACLNCIVLPREQLARGTLTREFTSLNLA